MARSSVIEGVLVAILSLMAISSHIVQPANGSNILGVFLSPSPSHLVIQMSIMKTLAERGHNVTVFTAYNSKVQHENITQIVIAFSEKHRTNYAAAMSELTSGTGYQILNYKNLFRINMEMQYDVLVDERFKAFYENKDNKFDVVILGYVLNNFQIFLGAKFNCPIIMNWVNRPMELVDDFVGNPPEVSYVPDMHIETKLGEVMSFSQRLNTYFRSKWLKVVMWYLDNRMEEYYNKLNEMDPTLPPYDVMLRNISILLCNSHYSEGPIRPFPPAMILIGGIQIKDKPDPLPKNLADFLAASEQNGAILFSLGTNIKDTHLNPEIWTIVFNVLSTLKQNVIWRWDDLEHTPGNATNILYQKWLPQDDILAHPNIKLFITHAGKGGITEATYHGVPMVAIPIFGDQPPNSKAMVKDGYGVELDKTQITETLFRNAIEDVLYNSSYANAVKTFSNLYRDRPLSARESVIYWTEYVIRHHGAAHLQSPLVHMNYIQSSSLDVHLLICFTLFIVYTFLKVIFRFVKNKLFSRKVQKSKKEKKVKQK